MAKGPRGGFPGGMGGMGGGNMNQMLLQAQRMQKEMEKAQEEVAAMSVEATAGGGAVKVTINGEHQITALSIDRGVVDPEDVEMLQDLIMVAVNDAQKQFETLSTDRMNRVTGGRSLPIGF